MIISFAKTIEPLLAGKKTVTRREWADDYAARFKAGQIVDAWDYSPRTGHGKRIAKIRLTADAYQEFLSDMPESDIQAEGGLWRDKNQYIRDVFGIASKKVWVIRFELVETEKEVK